MSKRLQVLLSEDELNNLKKLAKSERLSVGEWVRRVLRGAAAAKSSSPADEKLRVLREAYKYSFPTGEIDQLNSEIERGYSSGLP